MTVPLVTPTLSLNTICRRRLRGDERGQNLASVQHWYTCTYFAQLYLYDDNTWSMEYGFQAKLQIIELALYQHIAFIQIDRTNGA